MIMWNQTDFEAFLDRYGNGEIDENERLRLREEARDSWAEIDNEFIARDNRYNDLQEKYIKATELNVELSRKFKPADSRKMMDEEESSMEKLISKIRGKD